MDTATKHLLVTPVEGGSITTPKGFHTAGIHTGVKRYKLDLGVLYCEVPASSAAVYTLNKVQAAPIKVTKESIAKEGKLQAVIVNSGNANACTGTKGMEDAYTMRKTTAEVFEIPEHYVAVSSTGVIGEFLQMEKIVNGIKKIKTLTQMDFESAERFNEAILTTDTINKRACFQTTIGGKTVTFGGVAKGSGMIHPNMATMLAFVTTDANIEPKWLQIALSKVIDETFNRITVDGDTSTNDTVVTLASGLANNDQLTKDHPDWDQFVLGLKMTCEHLAKKIARDGEGATKLIEVQVKGALNDQEAGKVAKSIVGSDLVKSAIYGTDANWGRIICAIGYSEAEINPDTIDIAIGEIQTLKDGMPIPFSEEEATQYLSTENIVIYVDLKIGHGFGKAWGCDLTYDYVRINAGYRT
ncbi:bifunctional ornithine acetyltransferase/N-acetylglutamate synthase [Anaerobacillus alkalidiazotrophicus]|uniref:Arginine biosynthesis bifunctional protein ArgJ n=1 Tax=Anaerobacillus alkalidiazotrophicus TaxID=472963 RepID=A0A1S2M1S7_9BACI|nr:bifunctional ornithine acetyltransferase/N-acetylglutamate synthase [Anaerobacillus alkalidiazotrophicus]OIJ18460.1 bifunctional ornithine acetyltransferase/N-acetylglutamate synthase [Anaerobacillus alkalidiazotrophicus]OIJ19939.1 bifunctional ornithine acetyltransferase/N-acetylglutamate synthase [Anaerobacillus alkalidiazotrophicus]